MGKRATCFHSFFLAMLVLATATAHAVRPPDYLAELADREPELVKILTGSTVSEPDRDLFVGRTLGEYNRAVADHYVDYAKSLPPKTNEFIYTKLQEGLQADPPDAAKVLVALMAARFAPDDRVTECAAQILDDLPSMPKYQNNIAGAAMQRLADSKHPAQAAKVQSYLELGTLAALKAKGMDPEIFGRAALDTLRRLPKDEAEQAYARISKKLRKDYQQDPTDAKAAIEKSMNTHIEFLKKNPIDPNAVLILVP